MEKLQKMEETMQNLGKKTKELAMAGEKLNIMIEAMTMDKLLRIRGLPEEK